MNKKSQLPRRQKNQTTIWLDRQDNDLIFKPISFEVFSTKGKLKNQDELTYGFCWKFLEELPCVGAIWYAKDNFEAMVHECVHLAHHIIKLKLIKISPFLQEQYNEHGLWTFSKEEKICQIAGAITNKVYINHFTKYANL